MSDLVNFAVPLAAYEQQGFDARSEQIRKSRLENRKAMMEIADEAARRGVNMTVEDMAAQAKSLLGPGDWLYSLSPSVDVLNSMKESQNALATQTQEKTRREKFSNDITETKQMTDAISEWAVGGDGVDIITQKGIEQFGDRFAKVAPNLTRVMEKANYTGMQEGINIANSMKFLTDDATDFIAQNKGHLPESTQQGILKTAQANMQQAERQVMTEAKALAGAGGWAGTAEDSENIRNIITSNYPTMKPETVEKLYSKAMTAAKVAAGTKVQVDDNAQAQAARQAANQQAANLEITLIGQEEKDIERRDAKAAAFKQQNVGVLQRQQEIAARLGGNPKTGAAPLLEKAEDRTVAAGILSSYKVDNVEEMAEVIKTKDPKKIKQYTANLMPIALYQDRVDQTAMLTTTPMSSYKEFMARGASLGATPKALADMGAKYKEDMDAFMKNAGNSAPTLSSGGVLNNEGFQIAADAMGIMSTPLFTKPGGYPKSQVTTANDMAQASRVAAETRINGVIEATASQIRAMREMASINQSFSADPASMAEAERELALGLARKFLSGAGFSADENAFIEGAIAMADGVMKAVGDPMPLNRRLTAADKLSIYKKSSSTGQGVYPDSRVPPGSIQPNQRAGYATGTAPPPF